MRSEIRRRVEEELRLRAKSREIKERLGRAEELERQVMEARISKLEKYSQKLQESRRNQQELREFQQKTMQDNYTRRLAELAERQLKKQQLDEERLLHYKAKEADYKQKVTSIKEYKSAGSKAEDAKRLEKLRQLEAECTVRASRRGRSCQ